MFGLVKLEPSTIDTPFLSGDDLDPPEDQAIIQHEPNNIILFAREENLKHTSISLFSEEVRSFPGIIRHQHHKGIYLPHYETFDNSPKRPVH